MKIYQILFFFIFSFQAIAQQPLYDFSGKIHNHKGEPLQGVSIQIKGLGKGSISAQDGSFILQKIKAGKYQLLISSVGYQSQIVPIHVAATPSEALAIVLVEGNNHLQEVIIEGTNTPSTVEKLPEVNGTYVTAGKKNEVINLQGINANIAEKNARQIFAKIPGVFVYDMDGSGNQVNIATRGLDPHRSWEYNIRQNGVITNSDMYGYPASHYSPAMESIDKIELIRGTSSLQYGAQFGGMINYKTKQADTSGVFHFESLNTAGSYGLFSSYNAISGKVGKLSYMAYYQKRHSDGYRKNSKSDAESQFVSLVYEFNKKLTAKAEFGRSSYIYQIPGPLTDAMFEADPRQATRSRNYFNPDIYVPSLTVDWAISPNTQLKWTTSAVLGSRNSVLFDAFANVADAINPSTGQYANRQVDIDNFHSYTSELRVAHHYQIGSLQNYLVGGVQYMNNDLNRRQLGKGTTGSDFDLTLTNPTWGRDLHFKTNNIAFFLENLIYVSPKMSFSPGIRVENGATDMTGTISYYKPENLPTTIKHHFALLGINWQYKIDTENRLYAGFAQAYRPVVFKDIIPSSVLERIDKNLKDAYGYNLEAGITGKLNHRLTYDIGVFQIQYNNRLGQVVLEDENKQSYIFRTNIGDSRTRGIESYIEYQFLQSQNEVQSGLNLSVFTSTSYFDAKYQKASVAVNGENTSVEGKRLEGVPNWISRNGLQLNYQKLNATIQYSYVGKSYADALNTETPTVNGAKGLVPSYSLLDINATYRINKNYTLRLGINNVTNKQYFTKRPTMYPGAGIWSSDGRSIIASVGIKI
ncbi:TonB-dependent receptor [Flectobacillus major]|uniref:TonB-dependent receptor n=1 Tax=Flectobacillus major TaxID=103 RepID=UPI00040E6B6C|nr:TonB-dependent receptor [Flectobacillus major]